MKHAKTADEYRSFWAGFKFVANSVDWFTKGKVCQRSVAIVLGESAGLPTIFRALPV